MLLPSEGILKAGLCDPGSSRSIIRIDSDFGTTTRQAPNFCDIEFEVPEWDRTKPSDPHVHHDILYSQLKNLNGLASIAVDLDRTNGCTHGKSTPHWSAYG
ncbi:hypothetical protein CC2G_002788 [Coprinopsis cinerea AmutBmut pab1-1]|nr:hypothetical protein CC2G_002788 [Coprinopsis cinerea AmutBmut pab1-1]